MEKQDTADIHDDQCTCILHCSDDDSIDLIAVDSSPFFRARLERIPSGGTILRLEWPTDCLEQRESFVCAVRQIMKIAYEKLRPAEAREKWLAGRPLGMIGYI